MGVGKSVDAFCTGGRKTELHILLELENELSCSFSWALERA